MSDLVRTIIKWLIVIALTILIIILIISISTKNDSKASKTENIKPIENIKVEDTIEDLVEDDSLNQESTLIVETKETGTTRGISLWIGIIVLSSTSYYLYKNQLKSE